MFFLLLLGMDVLILFLFTTVSLFITFFKSHGVIVYDLPLKFFGDSSYDTNDGVRGGGGCSGQAGVHWRHTRIVVAVHRGRGCGLIVSRGVCVVSVFRWGCGSVHRMCRIR